MKRAIRRAHQKRIFRKRLKQFSYLTKFSNYIEWIKHIMNNPKNCSCPSCGNPRRHFKQKTRQELIAELDEEEYVSKYY